MAFVVIRLTQVCAATVAAPEAASAASSEPNPPTEVDSSQNELAKASNIEGPPERALTLRFTAERTYGMWKRDYEGSYLAPGGSAFFALRLPETIDAFRGRIWAGEARRGEVSGRLSFAFEVSDEIPHRISIAGLDHSFTTRPLILTFAGGLEVPFLNNGGFAGMELGASTVNESVTSVSRHLKVDPASTRFGLTGELHLGYRFLIHRPLVLGAIGSAEYHFLTNSFRLGLGILLEVDPTR
jgi:hypothetical protein